MGWLLSFVQGCYFFLVRFTQKVIFICDVTLNLFNFDITRKNIIKKFEFCIKGLLKGPLNEWIEKFGFNFDFLCTQLKCYCWINQ